MELPKQCFCGCGRPTGKVNAANMEGVAVAINLGRWLNFVSIMKRADPNHDWSEVDRFMSDGAHVYRLLRTEVHGGTPTSRKDRKLARRWVKFSGKSQDKIEATLEPAQPNPFDAPFPPPPQIADWVDNGTLLPIEEN